MQVSDYKARVALEGVGEGGWQGKGVEEKWVGRGVGGATTGLLLVSTLSPSLLFLLSFSLSRAWT